MFSTTLFRELYRHMEWADAEVWRVISQTAEAEGDEALLDKLYHTHATQRVFLQLWSGESIDRYDPSRFSSLKEIYEWVHSYHNNATQFLSELNDADLDNSLLVPWSRMFERTLGRTPELTTLGQTIFQVANHTTYHRGQINSRLRELGGEPPLVDYIAWIWGGRPSPVWEGY
ncbi:MAG: DinB family protein [Candidatus Kapaibacterium sp.]